MKTQAAGVITFTHPLARVAPRRCPSLSVSVVSTAHLAVISVVGAIDLDTLPVLHRELWKVRVQDRNHLVVDLTAVTFMDAGALGLLVAVQQWVNASNGSLLLCLNARGVRLMRLTRLTGFFTIEAERPCAESCLSQLVTSPPGVPAPRTASPERPHVRGDEVILDDVRAAPTASVWLGERVGLSAHEGAVVSLIVLGLSNEEIADALYMSEHSVQTHIRSAYRTMGVTRRAQAISWGVHHSLRLTASAARLNDGGQQ